jgi:hypothetical protein
MLPEMVAGPLTTV